MCGIAGGIGVTQTPPDPETIVAMLGRIGHRGPDEAGYYVDDRVALGNVRLSILDLASGQQPMADPAERFWITYNGEIYNYVELRDELIAAGVRFRTTCDTEVLLAAWRHWGADCLPRLNGAFAFAIWDREKRELVLARDRFGKRPLFWMRHGGRIWFASEMKAFLEVPGFDFVPDRAQVASILAGWTPLPAQSAWQGIESLPMAQLMRVSGDGSIQTNTYASLDFADDGIVRSRAEAVGRIRDAVTEAVRLRMRSDVPVGVYLSGGLDSSIVTEVASRYSDRRLSTFSVEFEEASLDESPYQRMMSDQVGTDHTALRITAADLCEAFPQALYHAEVPVFRTAFVPMFLLSQAVRNAGIKTVLSGEGADEVFLGYSLFREVMLRNGWHDMTPAERKARIADLNPYLGHFTEETHGPLMGLYKNYLTETQPGLFSHEIRFQNGRFALRLLAGDTSDAFAPLQGLVADAPEYAGLNPVARAQWLEFRTLLAGYLLSTQGERMGLAHGVENRCPFLDPSVVALAGSVNLKHDGGWTEKGLLKEAFPELPEPVRTRHKHPYRAPDSASFMAERPDYMELLLSDAELEKDDLIDARFASALVRKISNQPPERISVRENQAFVYLLSLRLLQQQFASRPVRRAPLPQDVRDRMTVARDERCMA
ncbi:asparagine synthase (glutamine-hydrolyzing) [Antarctobacter jejuensis]|uniref:asparagine synthase (glutamine-hydrolyzing) n=1 Tax=Antarctobacter jejuensis TaxID=1439938 RepID=UPI003FD6BB28